jgi:hypothetical protein
MMALADAIMLDATFSGCPYHCLQCYEFAVEAEAEVGSEDVSEGGVRLV